jgi:hypothetical protein
MDAPCCRGSIGCQCSSQAFERREERRSYRKAPASGIVPCPVGRNGFCDESSLAENETDEAARDTMRHALVCITGSSENQLLRGPGWAAGTGGL